MVWGDGPPCRPAPPGAPRQDPNGARGPSKKPIWLAGQAGMAGRPPYHVLYNILFSLYNLVYSYIRSQIIVLLDRLFFSYWMAYFVKNGVFLLCRTSGMQQFSGNGGWVLQVIAYVPSRAFENVCLNFTIHCGCDLIEERITNTYPIVGPLFSELSKGDPA